jgi:dTDP-4-dehydrorhamnose 3,5-epimerase|tara:strand:- start:122 stop:649 length:528 start_codon:yes stop_codon:yes gene_type:complete
MFNNLNIQGSYLISKPAISDERGSFHEVMNRDILEQVSAMPNTQIYISNSKKGVLRGMHYQIHTPQSKLITCIRGAVIDFAVDLRIKSPTFLKTIKVELNEKNNHSVFLPQGLAHGFISLEDNSTLLYQINGEYVPENERGVHYSSLQIDLPFKPSLINNRDNGWPKINDCEYFL